MQRPAALGDKAVLTAEELYSFLDGKLAKYKWPRSFEFVEEIPTNSMGKTLKRVLRQSHLEGTKA